MVYCLGYIAILQLYSEDNELHFSFRPSTDSDYLLPTEGTVAVLVTYRARPHCDIHLRLDDAIAIMQTLFTPATN